MGKLPEKEGSLWRDVYGQALYLSLKEEIDTDVAIVGAGITGLTAAYLLMKSGLRVAVVEKHTVGGGTTGRTTGKVTSQHNLIYAELVRRFGQKTATFYGEANQAAINMVEKIINAEKIDCDWQRDDNYVYTADQKQLETFKRETEAAKQCGLPARFTTKTPLPFPVAAAVTFADQAKFHSVKYLLGLARTINDNGDHIFENSTVIGIRDGDPARIKTSHGAIYAKHIIVASSIPTFPLLARGGYAILEYPEESYIVAGKPGREISGMYISPDKSHYSILPIKVGGEPKLLIGGESHFWGLRGNRTARFERLAAYGRQHFGLKAITHYWSDRDYLSYDNIPLVGKLYPWSKNLYVGTGFKKWGLSNGTAAGMILADLIMSSKNDWAHTFRALRTSPVTSIPRIVGKMISGR